MHINVGRALVSPHVFCNKDLLGLYPYLHIVFDLPISEGRFDWTGEDVASLEESLLYSLTDSAEHAMNN
jgi:hypothetical protein